MRKVERSTSGLSSDLTPALTISRLHWENEARLVSGISQGERRNDAMDCINYDSFGNGNKLKQRLGSTCGIARE
jgi:hypothetical protein